MSDSEKDKKRKNPDPEGSIIPFEYKYRTAQGRTKTETRFYVRKRYTDSDGVKREKRRTARSFNEAIALRRQINEEIERELNTHTEVKDKTFNNLADFYVKEYVKPARYAGNEKIEGLKDKESRILFQINNFRSFFGSRLLKSITYQMIRDYKMLRLSAPVEREIKIKTPIDKATRPKNSRRQFQIEKQVSQTPRSPATVNRELARLRKMLNIAVTQRWLDHNPFSRGDSLIKSSAEIPRTRVLSAAEEARLLAACCDRSAHLKSIIIFAIDTFMRKAEIFGLRWQDVNFEKRAAIIPKELTKNYRSRTVPLSQRVIAELAAIKRITGGEPENLVFGIKTAPKTAFYNALKRSRLEGFRFHDLRATGITRALLAGIPPNIVMEFSGHSVWATFQRYIRLTDDSVSRFAGALDEYQKRVAA